LGNFRKDRENECPINIGSIKRELVSPSTDVGMQEEEAESSESTGPHLRTSVKKQILPQGRPKAGGEKTRKNRNASDTGRGKLKLCLAT